MKFATPEWAKAYCKAINDNENYGEAAGPIGFPPDGWEGDFLFTGLPCILQILSYGLHMQRAYSHKDL